MYMSVNSTGPSLSFASSYAELTMAIMMFCHPRRV